MLIGKLKWLAMTIVFLSISVFVVLEYYEYIFARTIEGVIVGIQRVSDPVAIIGGRPVPASQMFSYAVAIKEAGGEILTASSEDRQWAVVKEGQCVSAKFYPYPPWELGKSGTYHGARILRLSDCPVTTDLSP